MLCVLYIRQHIYPATPVQIMRVIHLYCRPYVFAKEIEFAQCKKPHVSNEERNIIVEEEQMHVYLKKETILSIYLLGKNRFSF